MNGIFCISIIVIYFLTVRFLASPRKSRRLPMPGMWSGHEADEELQKTLHGQAH